MERDSMTPPEGSAKPFPAVWVEIQYDGKKVDAWTEQEVEAMADPKGNNALMVRYVPESLLAAAKAQGRAEAFEEGYKEWLKRNPDFKPNNRYDDFYKDAFYCGYGRAMREAARGGTTEGEKNG